MPWFVFWRIYQDAPIRLNQVIHGWAVGRNDGSAATHGFHDVVTPTFGEGRAQVDGMFVDEGDDVLLTEVVGDEFDVLWNFLRCVVLVLEQG